MTPGGLAVSTYCATAGCGCQVQTGPLHSEELLLYPSVGLGKKMPQKSPSLHPNECISGNDLILSR